MKNNIKIYLSSSAFQSIDEAVNFAHHNSCNIEISKFARPMNIDSLGKDEIENLKSLFRDFQLEKPILHGTCYDLFPASLDNKIVNVTIERLKQSVELAKAIDAKTVVFHSGYNGQIKVSKYIEKFIEKQIIFWRNFIQETSLDGIIIALENTYEDDPYILKRIIEGVGDERFRSCIDIGHINVYSKYSLRHWLNVLWRHLHHFHLHYNNGKVDQHAGFEENEQIIRELYRQITKNESEISLTLEMFKKEDLTEGLSSLKKLMKNDAIREVSVY